jgi:hypothetical protein
MKIDPKTSCPDCHYLAVNGVQTHAGWCNYRQVVTCCWFSRHPPLEAQKQALEKLFPGHRLVLDGAVFADVDDIVERVETAKRLYGAPVELVIVAPLSLVQKLIGKGIHPLYPVMREIATGTKADWLADQLQGGQ